MEGVEEDLLKIVAGDEWEKAMAFIAEGGCGIKRQRWMSIRWVAGGMGLQGYDLDP